MADPKLPINNVAASSYVKPYEAKRAFNGDISPLSRWLCNTLPGWLGVDLGNPYYVSRWVVKQMPLVAGWNAPEYCLSDYSLQGSNDNINFFNIDLVSGNRIANFDKTLTSAQKYQYFRVNVTQGLNSNTKLASIMEFELYGAKSSYLTGLVVSSGALSPVFAKTTYSYTAPSVPNTTTSITITPTAEDAGAAITVKGAPAKSGQPAPVSLNVGSNAIDIVVTGADGVAQQKYTVNVTRAAAANSALSALTLSAGTLDPAFDKTKTSYTASVGFGTASITVTPTADASTSTIKVNGTLVVSGSASGPIALNVGPNTITIEVTAEGGTAKTTYTVTLTKSSDTNLKRLVSNKPLTPNFSPTWYNYEFISSTASFITIIPTLNDTSATLKVNGIVKTSGTPTMLATNPGTVITITIDPATGSVPGVYTITDI